MFLLSGGDSLKAIKFHEDVQALLAKALPGLLEVILGDTIEAVCRHIIRSICPEKDDKSKVHGSEVEGSNAIVYISTKEHRKRKADLLSSSPAVVTSLVSLSRGCQYFKPCVVIPGSIEGLDLPEFFSSGCKQLKAFPCSTQTLSLRQRWISDTSKCVDASPLLILASNKDVTVTVYIGSHSHRMQALDLHTGTVVWERILGDRIESSAALSACGNYIIVGNYSTPF